MRLSIQIGRPLLCNSAVDIKQFWSV